MIAPTDRIEKRILIEPPLRVRSNPFAQRRRADPGVFEGWCRAARLLLRVVNRVMRWVDCSTVRPARGEQVVYPCASCTPLRTHDIRLGSI